MPPSADDLSDRIAPESRPGREKKAKRRPGKQPGAPGSFLAWSEHPGDTVPHFPQGACGFGRDLAGAADLGVAASHQEIDIPLAAARVIQHDLHEVGCACGAVHRAPAPAGAGAPGTVTYSVQLQAWCVFLIAAHYLPVHRAAQLVESLTGARPSPEFVHALIARAAAAVAQANALIRALIVAARVVCADETPIRCGPGPKSRKRYLLVACTHLLTYGMVGDRSLAAFKSSCSPTCPAPSSCTTATRTMTSSPALPISFCLAHLLRDVEDAQCYPGAIWPGQIADALRGLIHRANLARARGLAAVPDQATAPLIRAFRHGVRVGLADVRRVPAANTRQPPARLLLECLRDRELDVLRFLSDLRIPPTSNQADYAEFGVMRTRRWMSWHAGGPGPARAA
jgi:transposase